MIAERFNFHKRNQETISDFIAELHKLAMNCEFGDYLKEALRDRFVCRLHSEATQKQLLTKVDLTFKRAVEVGKGIKIADKKSQQLKQAEPVEVNNSKPAQPCYRCGKEGHSPSACHFKDATCHNCNKKGHIAKACRSAK